MTSKHYNPNSNLSY